MSQPAFDFDDVEVGDPANPTYTVAELADAINESLRRSFDEGVWVRGEIEGLSNRGPHTYFSLVERTDGEKAVLNVQLFAPMKRNLLPILKRNRLELRDGMKVRIFGQLDFWAAGGRLGLKMAGLDPRYTLGEIAQTRDEVMRRLVAEGLLDRNGRCPLSPAPLSIGVVTSVDSAAWHDFRDELVRSRFGFRLVVTDTRVQGEFAVPMIAGAIGTLARRTDLDAIVVIRGGGARNELAVFDAEVIARTIAACDIPVLTGLGHEIDRSVADEVAHTALKTPTACAGALVERVASTLGAAEQAWAEVVARSQVRLAAATGRLSEIGHRVARGTDAAIGRADRRLHSRVEQLADRAPRALDLADARLGRAGERVTDRARARLDRADDRIAVLQARIAALDPAVQLARGWSITRRSDGRIVRTIDDLTPGETISTEIARGRITSTVVAIDDQRTDQADQADQADDATSPRSTP